MGKHTGWQLTWTNADGTPGERTIGDHLTASLAVLYRCGATNVHWTAI